MNRYIRHTLSFLITGLASTSLYAAEDIKIRGFFSQAMVVSEDNEFFGTESGTHFDYREFGLNASWELNPKLRISGQLLSRKVGTLEDGDPEIDFLLADYNFYVDDTTSAGIRLGRVKSEYGIYNTVRDVPHAKPGIFVPPAIYFEAFRGQLLALDGGAFYLNHQSGIGELNLDVFGGKSKLNNNGIEQQAFQSSINGEFEEVEKNGFKISFVPSSIPGLYLAFSLFDASVDLESIPNYSFAELGLAAAAFPTNPLVVFNYLSSYNIDTTLQNYSIQYNWRDWIFTGEYTRLDTEITNAASPVESLFPPTALDLVFADQKRESGTYYLQAEWQASEKISFYARYDDLYFDKEDKDGTQQAAQSPGFVSFARFNKRETIGSRWYITPDFSLTGEYSKNRGVAFLIGSEDTDYQSLEKDWDLFILQASYHFSL